MTALKKNMPFIKLLATAESKQKDSLLNTMSRSQLELLRQLARNIIEGELIVSKQSNKELGRYKNKLIKLADSREKGRKLLCLKLRAAWPRIIKAVLPQLELLE